MTIYYNFINIMYMQEIVSITSQGQLTIPASIRQSFGIKGSTKAIIKKEGDLIIVKPKKDFWSLESSLNSEIKLTDDDLKKARESFSKNWPKK